MMCDESLVLKKEDDIKEKFDVPDVEKDKITGILVENSAADKTSEMHNNQELEN